ncbi:amino acid/amide ABC transporter membrane protein 1 (HAAT family) [Murinocardiopsis flavida]|uniref:Amino acid/amide ABC transporter membrane protein 1 (HAAT family) n=1 Tax=Murinocardiopsis flavida TaxID=645275 RepID=A0A2P8CNL4_9ACTN|nr:branched-chain amino acid ABC transporter permease [Murinocardiopsis flavida]PSK86534.1 amino acid/amide ABC transporter membrane protein 1 (HAAT family) [Murinocardiopsis flavida]
MRRRLVTVLLAVVAAILASTAPAVADDQGGVNVNGQIRQPEEVEGIDITVFKGDEEIGKATTDPAGKWDVELPEPGDYRVVLDQKSVPKEFVVDDPPGHELEVKVREGQQRTVVFRLAPPGEQESEASPSESKDDEASPDDEGDAAGGIDSSTPFSSQVVQATIAGIVFGLIIAVSSIGLSLIFGTTKMINFAHGDMVTFGAMMALMFSTSATFGAMSLVPAALLAVILGGLLGLGLERFVWRPLRKRNVALIQMFIVSIGASLLLRHVLLISFGAQRNKYADFRIQELLTLGPVSISPRNLSIALLAIAVLVAVGLMLQFTRIGKAMRAVADNRDLSESSGIDVDRVTLYVWGMGGALAALGGVFYGLYESVHWQMGFHLLLLMFAGVILGGLGTAYGAMAGGVVIGLVATLSTLWFPAQLMVAFALAIMIIVLLVRPQGIMGRRERVG